MPIFLILDILHKNLDVSLLLENGKVWQHQVLVFKECTPGFTSAPLTPRSGAFTPPRARRLHLCMAPPSPLEAFTPVTHQGQGVGYVEQRSLVPTHPKSSASPQPDSRLCPVLNHSRMQAIYLLEVISLGNPLSWLKILFTQCGVSPYHHLSLFQQIEEKRYYPSSVTSSGKSLASTRSVPC